MTILFPIGSFYPAQLGGPANTVYWLARGLVSKGHDVYVGTTCQGIDSDQIRLNRWEKRAYGNVLYQSTWVHYMPLRLFFKLLRRTFKADIIHLTNIFYPLSWMMAGWIILTGGRKKIIWSVRGEFDDVALQFSPQRKKLAIWLVRTFLKTKVLFHSTADDETQNVYRQLGKNIRLVQLPNFIFLPAKMNLETTKTILYLGRLHPIKAIDNLISAFSSIPDKRGFTLIIAGDFDHSYGMELMELAGEKIHQGDIQFIGHVEGDAKQRLLASSYVLVLPSHSENFGNVVLEALAQGTPVIASQHTPWSILNQIAEGSWTPNDPQSLSAAIQRYIDFSPSQYEVIREKAYQICQSDFSMESNLNKWEETYTAMISSRDH